MNSLVVNSPAVVAEAFEEEVVVIHLERGTYYSLAGSAPRLWPLIGCGLDAAAIAARVAAATPGDAESVESAVLGFLRELEVEELLRPGAGSGAPPELSPAATFEPPTMEKFTDMQELIALDPVHDVSDAEGWPVKPPLTPKGG